MQIIRDFVTARDIETWTDENLVPGSPSWTQDIQDAIEKAKAVLAILSPAAKASHWVGEELAYSRAHSKHIFAVLINGTATSAVPLGLVGSQWIDLRQTKTRVAQLTRLAGALQDFLDSQV
jgi:hypothetical protein